VRAALAGKEDGDERECTTQLAKLLRMFADGVAAPQLASPAKVDVFAPHEFADFLLASRPRFALGSQHDAADFLSWALESSNIAHDCCRVGPVPRSEYEVVILNEFQPGAPEAALVQGEHINMQTLVPSCLQHEDTKLHLLPPVLLVRMPQFVHGGEDTENQWVQEEMEGAPPASWGDGFFDFAACCDDGCSNASDAVYRIKGFVQYCRKPPVPSQAVSSGHYAAFFQEGGVWYRCDDLRDGGRPSALQGAPVEFPYICFFEQVGQPRSPPPDLPANAVAVRLASQADAEVVSSDACEDEREEDGENDEAEEGGEEGEAAAEMGAAAKRRRRWDKRSRRGRKQDQDRDGRKQLRDQAGRKEDRTEREQNRRGRLRDAEDSCKRVRVQGPRNDNTDASRKDTLADQDSPVLHHLVEERARAKVQSMRERLGHIFVLLHSLAPCLHDGRTSAENAVMSMPVMYVYAGQDCHEALSGYLGRPPRQQQETMWERLREAFGITDTELDTWAQKAQAGEWQQEDILHGLRECLGAADINYEASPVLKCIAQSQKRLHDEGGASRAAMPMRLRRRDQAGAHPSLAYRCELCEAEGVNDVWRKMHVDYVHGGAQRYRNAIAILGKYSGSHVPSGTAKRCAFENARRCQEFGMLRPETLLPETTRRELEEVTSNMYHGSDSLWHRLVDALALPSQVPDPCTLHEKPPHEYLPCQPNTWARQPRQFLACVFCALQHWSEELHQCFIAGPGCFMQSPRQVAQLLSTAAYAEAWPQIPRQELDASSVALPHLTQEGGCTTTLVLMHKRRVPLDALQGASTVCVCSLCYDALSGKKPTMPKFALANFLWLGRHIPLLRNARLGHQLLLALGRVVSTKVYLSSRGRDEQVRQHTASWRQKFLQQGMQGTAIVFGNGDASRALAEFPPSADVLQESFVAVFTGPEKPTPEEERNIQGNSAENLLAQKSMAASALRSEVELQVEKELLDKQARYLMETNYVYNETGTYRSDLVEAMPPGPHVPAAFEAAATFVRVDHALDDTSQALGPASSTTAGQQELAQPDDEIAGRWMSVLDESLEDAMEMSKIPALQGLLERLENQAGRVVANEIHARTESEEDGAQDGVGRQRLQLLCKEFHQHCTKATLANETRKLDPVRMIILVAGQIIPRLRRMARDNQKRVQVSDPGSHATRPKDIFLAPNTLFV